MKKIPTAVIAVVSNVIANHNSHGEIDQLMEAAGLEMNQPPGNKQVKTKRWLVHANTRPEPLRILGEVIAAFMEKEVDEWDDRNKSTIDGQQEIAKVLANYGMTYMKGGYIAHLGTTSVTKTLNDIIRARDLPALQTEFDRIQQNLEADPPAAVTASCAILEALFKAYIEKNKLTMPSDQSVKPLWKVVRNDLNLDPATVKDDDLKTILGGLASITEGVGALRTHKGSAHGQGKTAYKLKPRHARLAAHAASTLANYVLEAWAEREVEA